MAITADALRQERQASVETVASSAENDVPGADAANTAATAAETVFAYHGRTKHRFERYAAGPETLDWDMQPNPFREFAGSPRIDLPLMAEGLTAGFDRIYTPEADNPTPLTVTSLSALLELAAGLSAWKEFGPDRWALRCNPSSGNLHPTEAYVLASAVPGLDDGIYHYLSRDHGLEQRRHGGENSIGTPRLWIGLSSVHWRETWKYGERAFRYCQLDIGHALGAVRYAAGALGWTARLCDIGGKSLGALLGLDRPVDFSGVESEEADLLIAIDPRPQENSPRASAVPENLATGQWSGRANLLDPHPMYRWPIIDQVATATQISRCEGDRETLSYLPPLRQGPQMRAANVILGRRSAQRFDSKFKVSAAAFYRMLDCLLARPIAPWDVWDFAPRLHPIIFVHRVQTLEPGLYALVRRPEAAELLQQSLRPDFEWRKPKGAPVHLPFFRLTAVDCRAVARTSSCHQAIASDGCFALSMLGEFESVVQQNAWRYRQLHWEAGLLGHVLYLEAEAAGLRGTGIGCFFDDALHHMLEIKTLQFQALYHFTVGLPFADNRIATLPAYPGRRSASGQPKQDMP